MHDSLKTHDVDTSFDRIKKYGNKQTRNYF